MLITAAWKQALRANNIKVNIDKEDLSPECGKRKEIIVHIVAEYTAFGDTIKL